MRSRTPLIGAMLGVLAHTSAARAQLPRAALQECLLDPPSIEIELRSPVPRLRMELLHPGLDEVLLRCEGDCRSVITPGPYQLKVEALKGNTSVTKHLELLTPSVLEVTPKSRAQRDVGLALGIGGVALAGLGAMSLIPLGLRETPPEERDSEGDFPIVVIPVTMIVTGVILAPIGWILFGTGFGPKVEVRPLSR